MGTLFDALKKDWKFIVMFLVALIGVFVPYWIFRIDQGGKTLELRVLSQSQLQPGTKDSMPGLQVVVDGSPVADPFLSILRLTNNGAKPITSKDFEAPLEVRLDAPVTVVRARISETAPSDVVGDIESDKQSVRLKPMLLNANDAITLSILSAGGKPSLSTKARIAGVSSVPILDATQEKPNKIWAWALFSFAFVCLALACILFGAGLDARIPGVVMLDLGLAWSAALILAVMSELAVGEFLKAIGEDTLSSFLLTMFVTAFFAIAYSFRERTKLKRKLSNVSAEIKQPPH